MTFHRRHFLYLTSASLCRGADAKLDRKAIVSRHNPMLRSFDPRAPLSVGNGEFAFTVDATGLQTFPELYEKEIPLCTQSQWGWHTAPGDGLRDSDLRLEPFDTYGRQVGYPTRSRGQEKLFNWLRENPHRLHLGRIALDGVSREDISDVEQTLDLWTGLIRSRFKVRGKPVTVETCCHPTRDAIAVRVDGEDAGVVITFPYGSPQMNAADWSSPEKHRTVVERNGNAVVVRRELDADHYFARLNWSGDAAVDSSKAHRVALRAARGFGFVVEFGAEPLRDGPLTVEAVAAASAKHWAGFWSTGGAIDFSGCGDRRAAELERRTVLSQYLTAIQCSGSMPPQETGLTCNSWYGKFHLEMHWWHAAHFASWGRTPLLERSLDWYAKILPSAREKARAQGYTGARWPKMVGPDGRDSPSSVGPLLIWQQPHPIAMAELVYRAAPTKNTLERFRDVVMESAEFMASFTVMREGRYVLGPPVIPAQENHPARETWNPTYELAYWKDALKTAQLWRSRLGLPANEKWEDVRRKLAPYPVKDGVYLAHANCPQTFTERNRDHPSMLMAYGLLDGEGIDRETMRATLKRVFRDWRWADTWGWDFPMVAMTAARLGEQALAMDALFIESPKNTWLANGHNWQRPNLPVYLPGNGALLLALPMMNIPGSRRAGFRPSGT